MRYTGVLIVKSLHYGLLVGLLLLAVAFWGSSYFKSDPNETLGGSTSTQKEARPEANRERAFLGWKLTPPVNAADFTLIDHHDAAFRLRDQSDHGKVVVLFFGYTMCPDVCPTTLAQFKAARVGLGELADSVRFVFVTVDPDRDTRERLNQYMGHYGPGFIALTGDVETLRRVWNDYGIEVERVEAPGSDQYHMNHTSLTYVIDTEGLIRVVHPFGMPSDNLVADLRLLLQP